MKLSSHCLALNDVAHVLLGDVDVTDIIAVMDDKWLDGPPARLVLENNDAT